MVVDPSIVVSAIAATASVAVGWMTRQVHYQVKNSHRTNLREDIDYIRAEVSGIRTDLRVEREERLSFQKRVDADLRSARASQTDENS